MKGHRRNLALASHAPDCTGIGQKVVPRLRESRILAPSGSRGGEITQPRAHLIADLCPSEMHLMPSEGTWRLETSLFSQREEKQWKKATWQQITSQKGSIKATGLLTNLEGTSEREMTLKFHT